MIARLLTLLVILAVSSDTRGDSPPSAILDLSRWKLTIPYDTQRKGNPDEVVQPELATFDDPRCFHASEAGDAVLFRASCDGLGTTNSNYPRSELREMDASGKDEASWATDDGRSHVLEVEQAVLQTPQRKKHVVCAQIHDAEDDVLMIRLEGDELFIEREGESEIELDAAYELGDRFALRIQASDGRIKVWFNDELKMDWKTSNDGCYFKVGCYTQSNLKKESLAGSYGEVAVYQLEVDHSE